MSKTRIGEASLVLNCITAPLKKGTAEVKKELLGVEKAAASVGKTKVMNASMDGMSANLGKMKKQYDELKEQRKGLSAKASGGGSGFLGTIAKSALAGATFGAGLAGFEGVSALAPMVADSIQLASSYEQTQLAFSTMLGSGKAAEAMLGKIQDFAKDSPMTFTDASKTVKQLIAYSVAADQAIPTLRALSDVSAGTGAPLEQLSLAYGQVASSGKMMAEELNQFTGAGVPMVQALAQALGKPEEIIKNMASAGKIGFPEMVKGFKVLTEESLKSGVSFKGMTDKFAGSFAGKLAQLTDGFEVLKLEFGTALIEELGLKDGLDDLGKFTDRIKSGVNEIRPAIRFVGDLGKGAVQFGYEMARALKLIAEIKLDKIGSDLPFLKNIIPKVQDFMKEFQDFKMDPMKVAKLADLFEDMTFDVFDAAGELFALLEGDANKGFIQPIVKAAQKIEEIVNNIYGVMSKMEQFKNIAANPALWGPAAAMPKMEPLTPQQKTQEFYDRQNRKLGGPQDDVDRGKIQLLFGLNSAPATPGVPVPVREKNSLETYRERKKQNREERDARLQEQVGRDLHDKNMNLMREMFKKAGAGQKDLLKVPEVKVLPRQIELAEKLNKDAPERLNPVGVFKRTMQDLDLLKAEKRIDAATADFAGRDAFESLTKMMGEGARRPSAIDYGSREAAKLEASAFGGGGEMNVEETLRAILKETERQTKQNEEANREFRRVLGLFGTKVVIPSN